MADAIAKIVEIFPKFAVLTNICFILFLILEIADDFDKIKKFVKRIFDFRKHVDTLLYAKKRKDYNKTLYSDDFLQWQMKIMDKIYAPLIDEANEELAKENSSAQIGITSLAFANSEEKPIHYESVPFV